MSLSLVLACIWAVVANLLAMLPSRDNHWRRAYLLVAVGIPILGYVTWQNGPWVGLFVLAAGMSLLRWPVIYLGRWARRTVGGDVARGGD
ncbi:hypothetical protein FIU86_07260 [Roseovarius sp. THAF9]|uniref:DUF2484 family protein n=1 Tax=Roseovarius sp. THAF9 TaxID=2587847 RepID=UPI0012687B1E|nr:DUF2484 family protein [Roseovarius sp. THAF9]QFT92635.1 hypothetical protein FIU86_07260 [Roseovarius sp. THAF9]